MKSLEGLGVGGGDSIRGERAGTALPASFNEALAMIADLKTKLATYQAETM